MVKATIQITSKSMSLAEGIVSRGIREMRCNTDFLLREMGRLSAVRQKNARKAWRALHNELPNQFTYLARGVCPDIPEGQAPSPVRQRLGSRNKKNKVIDDFGIYYFFERVSPKRLRLWSMSPDFEGNHLFPAIFPICNISHHALARIFYRRKAITGFHEVMKEVLCPQSLQAFTIMELGRDWFKSADIDKLWEGEGLPGGRDLVPLDIGTKSSCIPTPNGIFLLREADQSRPETCQFPSLADLYFTSHPGGNLAIASTWVPYEKIRADQEDFMQDIGRFWRQYQDAVMED